MTNKFKDLRTKAKLTQTELARALNLTQSMISHIEKEKRRVDLDTIKLYMDFFKVDANYFVKDEKTGPLVIAEGLKEKYTEDELDGLAAVIAEYLYKIKK